MRRRQALATIAATLAARSAMGQTKVELPIVGYLGLASRASDKPYVDAIRQGLARRGLVDGRTIELDDRYGDGSVERLGSLLAELVARGTKVLMVPGLAAAVAVRKGAPQLPVVAVGLPSTVVDPDLFSSLHRPGGSVTGFSHFGEDLAEKRVELLREVVPAMRTVAVLHNAIDPVYADWGVKTEAAAIRQGLEVKRLGLTGPSKADLAILMRDAEGAQGLVVVRDFLTHILEGEIVRMANVMRLATMAEQRSTVTAGALMAYGADILELFRTAGGYVERILEGADPALMPIQLATRFELVINLKTAAALDLTFPPAVMLRADEVIE